jgi:hypothetical protein
MMDKGYSLLPRGYLTPSLVKLAQIVHNDNVLKGVVVIIWHSSVM